MSPLEWMLAVRYLRLLHPRSLRLHIWSLLFFGIHVALDAAALIGSRRFGGFLYTHPMVRTILDWGPIVSLLAFVLVLFFVVLARSLTIFSTISTYGLFLGSGAMVVVLSVMSGFEKDLQHKILGANAHIVVTAPDKQFIDYKEIRKKLIEVKDVVAVSPFISDEVMITAETNLSGVILKGIDPETIGTVTDLSRNMEQGGLENLAHPDRLESTPPSVFGDSGHPVASDKSAGEKAAVDDPFGAKKHPPAAPPKDDQEDSALQKSKDGKPGVDFAPLDAHGKPLSLRVPRLHRILPALVVGRELAKSLRVYLGDDVNLISPRGDIGPTGEMPRSRPFRVGGIFYSGMYEYDSKYVYISIAAAQKFLGLDDEITGLELKVRDPELTAVAVEDIKKILGPGYDVQAWQELNRHLFSALKIERVLMFVILCFVILVASFSIIANGIMLVREKGREIAILKSMGISDGAVLRTFLGVGLFMGLVGTGVGVATGVGASLGLRYFGFGIDSDVFYISKLPVSINPYEIAYIFVAALGIALVAILYPAFTAARLRPVEGLRYE